MVSMFTKVLIYSEQLKECESKPLGMESGDITDDQITASSEYNSNYGGVHARLKKGGFWAAKRNDANQWIQVDLGKIMTVKGVATQGRPSSYLQCVTKYKLQYGNDGQTFSDYKEEGKSSAKVLNNRSHCSVESAT